MQKSADFLLAKKFVWKLKQKSKQKKLEQKNVISNELKETNRNKPNKKVKTWKYLHINDFFASVFKITVVEPTWVSNSRGTNKQNMTCICTIENFKPSRTATYAI